MIPQKSFAKRESIYDLIAQQGCADYEEIHQLIKKAQTLASIAPIGALKASIIPIVRLCRAFSIARYRKFRCGRAFQPR